MADRIFTSGAGAEAVEAEAAHPSWLRSMPLRLRRILLQGSIHVSLFNRWETVLHTQGNVQIEQDMKALLKYLKVHDHED